MSSQTKNVSDYTIVRLIGRGNFSHVYGGFHKQTKRKVAFKHITISSIKESILEKLMSEIIILKYINHPNIINLIDVVTSERSIYIILEYCKGGELQSYIQAHRKTGIPEITAKFFMSQLRDGLKVFNELGIIHRDLKPQNILLSENGPKAILKIADFGMARFMDPYDLSQTLCGTPLYMAPEILKRKKYSDNVDLWSIGVIMWEMVTGENPYKSENWMDLIFRLDTVELKFPPKIDASEECKNLLFSLLKVEPLDRIDFNSFYNHSFFSNIVPNRLEEVDESPVCTSMGATSNSTHFNNPFTTTTKDINDDWVIVNKNSYINDQLLSDIKLGSSMQDSSELLNKIKPVAELGDQKAAQGNIKAAGNLYGYSLNALSDWMSSNKTANKNEVVEFYNLYSSRRNSLTSSTAPLVPTTVENPEPEPDPESIDCDKIIFEEADSVSRLGAQNEIVEDYEGALGYYRRSLLLFQSLLTYRDMTEDDKMRLNLKIDCLNERILKTSTMLKSYP